jgi:rubrerythrin
LVAIGLLAVATAVLLFGRSRLRRLAQIDPESLHTGAVELAKRMGGELTVSQLRAEYRISEKQATDALESLVAEGTAERQQREDRAVYVFTGLLPSVAERVCPYCGTKLPIREALSKCPNCGANLEITKT